MDVDQDSNAFDFMLAGSHIDQANVLKIYANKYAKQNILEIPGVYNLGTLGAIWFVDMWHNKMGELYMDGDPSWIRFINHVVNKVRFNRVDYVLFYWP